MFAHICKLFSKNSSTQYYYIIFKLHGYWIYVHIKSRNSAQPPRKKLRFPIKSMLYIPHPISSGDAVLCTKILCPSLIGERAREQDTTVNAAAKESCCCCLAERRLISHVYNPRKSFIAGGSARKARVEGPADISCASERQGKRVKIAEVYAAIVYILYIKGTRVTTFLRILVPLEIRRCLLLTFLSHYFSCPFKKK